MKLFDLEDMGGPIDYLTVAPHQNGEDNDISSNQRDYNNLVETEIKNPEIQEFSTTHQIPRRSVVRLISVDVMNHNEKLFDSAFLSYVKPDLIRSTILSCLDYHTQGKLNDVSTIVSQYAIPALCRIEIIYSGCILAIFETDSFPFHFPRDIIPTIMLDDACEIMVSQEWGFGNLGGFALMYEKIKTDFIPTYVKIPGYGAMLYRNGLIRESELSERLNRGFSAQYHRGFRNL
jgi:hypothetical protein